MKKSITLFSLFFIITSLFSQNSKHSKPDHFCINQNILYKQYPYLYVESELINQGQNSFTVNKQKDIIWVSDSIYYYKSEFDEWYLWSQEKVMTRNNYGDMTSARRSFFNDNTKTWTKKDTISATYYTNGGQHTFIEKPWNSETQQWVDTLKYIENNENGDIIVSFFKAWDYDINEIDGGYKTIITCSISN